MKAFMHESAGPNQAVKAAHFAQPTLIAWDPGRLRAGPHAGLECVKGGMDLKYGHPSVLQRASSLLADEAGLAIWAGPNVQELTEQL